MEQFYQMLTIQLSLIVYLVAGIICYRLKIITEANRKQFIRFILSILMPCMVFNSFKSVTIEMIREGFLALLISLAVCLVTSIVGRYIYLNVSIDRRNIMRYGTLINNAGFAGLPVVDSVFGNNGLILASIFLIPIRIFMWSAGITMLSAEKQSALNVLIKLLKNPSIVAVFLGIFRGMLEIKLPEFLDTALISMSNAVSPMAMIAVGSIIATIRIKGLIDKDVLFFTVIRLGVIPITTLVITKFLGFSSMLIGVSTILTAMPAATTTALLAAQYNSDVLFASRLVFVTTVLSIITSPMLMLVL